MAERAGFEPAVPCGTQHFQCCTIGHSVTSPAFGFNALIFSLRQRSKNFELRQLREKNDFFKVFSFWCLPDCAERLERHL